MASLNGPALRGRFCLRIFWGTPFVKLALLHTAESNIAGFEEAGMKMGLSAGTLMHKVRADLLQAAREAGKLDAIYRTGDGSGIASPDRGCRRGYADLLHTRPFS